MHPKFNVLQEAICILPAQLLHVCSAFVCPGALVKMLPLGFQTLIMLGGYEWGYKRRGFCLAARDIPAVRNILVDCTLVYVPIYYVSQYGKLGYPRVLKYLHNTGLSPI